MKDKVGDILNELYDNVQDGEYWDKTMNDLTALMCYREVRSFMDAYNVFHGESTDENLRDEIIISLGADYDQDTILKAIEKYKNEQK